jgi:predicted ATPase
MDKFNRDLLVLFKEKSTPQTIEHELELLHELLFYVEKMDNLVPVYEVINVNKYKITSDQKVVRETLSNKILRPFVFLNNMN